MNASDAQNSNEVDLDLYLSALKRSRRIIWKSVIVSLSLAVLYLLLAEPQYPANVLIQADTPTVSSVSFSPDLESLAPPTDSVLATIEVLASRRVLGSVVKELNLDIEAEPNFFPLIGAPVSRILDIFFPIFDGLRVPPPGLARYAWGGEVIEVEQFDVPEYFEDEEFALFAKEGGEFELLDEDDNVIIAGKVGEIAVGRVKLPNESDGEVSILITKLIARPGTEFSVAKLPFVTTLEELQEDLGVAEVTATSGVVEVTFEGPKAEKTALIVNTLARTYVEQTKKVRTDEIDRVLEFVSEQLPNAERSLRAAEQDLARYHQDFGNVDVSLETTTLVTQLAEQERQLSDFELVRLDYERKYTKDHPNRVALQNKIAQLQGERDELLGEIAKLPASEIAAANVQRTVDIASQLYLLLLEKEQDLRVARAGLTIDSRIVDHAVVAEAPSQPLYLIVPPVAVALGGFVGVVLILFRKRNLLAITSAATLEGLGYPVIAAVPVSRRQARVEKNRPRKRASKVRLLSAVAPMDPAIQALRGLRNFLLYPATDTDSDRRVLVFFGAIPSQGKTFVALNLAYLIAEAGKDVVIVDADFGRGHLHSLLDKEPTPGLSDYILDGTPLPEILQRIDEPFHAGSSPGSLSLLGSGKDVIDPSVLFFSEGFPGLLSALEERFDVIVVATPPVNTSPDAESAAKILRGRNFMVLRAGDLVPDDLSISAQRLSRNGQRLDGVVLNCVEPTGRDISGTGKGQFTNKLGG